VVRSRVAKALHRTAPDVHWQTPLLKFQSEEWPTFGNIALCGTGQSSASPDCHYSHYSNGFCVFSRRGCDFTVWEFCCEECGQNARPERGFVIIVNTRVGSDDSVNDYSDMIVWSFVLATLIKFELLFTHSNAQNIWPRG
jgi:hypothetical protein